MDKNKLNVQVNANFHHVCGENLFAKDTLRFREYRQKWIEWPENFFTGPGPLFIDIEVTSACNLKCDFCATTFRGSKIKNGFISSVLVKKIIDEGVALGLYGVKFNIRGEPLLHPEICEFVKYAKDSGLVDVYFNTNALLLTEPLIKGLIESGLDRLSISFEGYTKEMYEHYRKGSHFETVVANIECLQELKKQMHVDHPKIRIQTVMLPEIESILPQYKQFWGARVEEVAFLDYKEMKDKRRGIKYPWACPQIWQRIAVWWDGTILPCNHDDAGQLALGNINDTMIKEAWHSHVLQELRAVHREGQGHRIPACDGCYLRDSEIAKLKGGKGE